jgi:hypothetical protein
MNQDQFTVLDEEISEVGGYLTNLIEKFVKYEVEPENSAFLAVLRAAVAVIDEYELDENLVTLCRNLVNRN